MMATPKNKPGVQTSANVPQPVRRGPKSKKAREVKKRPVEVLKGGATVRAECTPAGPPKLTHELLNAYRSLDGLTREKLITKLKREVAARNVLMPRPDAPKSYLEYLQQTVPLGWSTDARHIQLIAAQLDRVKRGEIDRLAIHMPPRHAKCQPLGSKVLLANGSLVAIENLCRRDTLISVNARYAMCMKPVTDVFSNGSRKVLRICLQSGRYIDCTENHPLLTVGGWVEASKLSIGDSAAVAQVLPVPNGEPLPVGFASLMGYITGDGSYARSNPIVTAADASVVEHLQEICVEHGWKLTRDGDISYHVRHRDGRQSNTRNGESAQARLRLYLTPAKSREKRVPECIFKANRADLVDFIGAYFASDGTTNPKREGVATLCSTSEGLLRDMQHLLTRINVWATLREVNTTYKGAPYRYWLLCISGEDLVKFADAVPVRGRKGIMLRRVAETARIKKHYPEHEAIPTGWQVYLDKGKSLGWLRNRHNIRADKKYKNGTARQVVLKVAEILDNDYLRKLCSPGIAWDRITAIQDLGDRETMGISVEDTKNYISGEVVSHNTETVSIRFANYFLENNPADNVLLTGYNERFARRLGRKARNIATERAQKGFISLDPAKKAADEWATRQGGVMMTRGVGSPPTGVGFKLIVIDDPIRRREDAESEAYREKAWDWYTDDLYTRLEPDGAIILVATTWHEDDVLARAVASEPGKWHVLKLPAFAEENDVMGRKVGEALWPERFNVQQLERIRDVQLQNDGERGWQALYQQNPRPREGSIFKASFFCKDHASKQLWEYPHGARILEAYISCDTAVKKNEANDYTAISVSLMSNDGFLYLYPLVLARMDLPVVVKQMALAWAIWRNKCGEVMRALRIEEGLAGGPAIQYARQLMIQARTDPTPQDRALAAVAIGKPSGEWTHQENAAMRAVRALQPPNEQWTQEEWDLVRKAPPMVINSYPSSGRGPIEERAQAIVPYVSGGNVRLVQSPCASAWLAQLLALPAGKHDDAVQSTIGAVEPFIAVPSHQQAIDRARLEAVIIRSPDDMPDSATVGGMGMQGGINEAVIQMAKQRAAQRR